MRPRHAAPSTNAKSISGGPLKGSELLIEILLQRTNSSAMLHRINDNSSVATNIEVKS